jgi:ABC-type amino acid transport system permease subunit
MNTAPGARVSQSSVLQGGSYAGGSLVDAAAVLRASRRNRLRGAVGGGLVGSGFAALAVSGLNLWLGKPAPLVWAALLLGLPMAIIGSWLILSHRVLPRLGPGRGGLARNRVATATAGAVFLAAWLPFNNGLRPEPLIAFGVLLVWMLVERTIATRRLAPVAAAIVVAVFCVTLAPQGLGALAPLLVGARAVARLIGARRVRDGLLAPLASLAAALSVFFVVVFRDQTLAAVAESVRIKYVVGPTISWYQDFLRYYFLTVEEHVEASLTRRFAVLVMLLCLFAILTMLLRKGQLPGMARGPVWRLIGSTELGLLLLTFTPTKWAVQFGAFAAGVISLALSHAAFEEENIRAGIQSVAKGQREAAHTLGLSSRDTFRYIVFPQAIRTILPALGNQFVYVLKMSSLVSVIGLQELTRRANELNVTEYRPLEIYTALVFEYLLLILLTSWGVRRLERRMASAPR